MAVPLDANASISDALSTFTESHYLLGELKENSEIPAEQKAEIVQQIKDMTMEMAEQYSDHPVAQVAASQVMIQAGDYEQAYGYAERAEQLAPSDPFAVVNKGVAAYHLGDMESAQAQAQRALEMDPGNRAAIALQKLSSRRDWAASPQEAARLVEEARPPSLRELLDSPELKEAGEAAVARKKAVELLDESSRRIMVGDYESAAALAAQSLEADPQFGSAHFQRGWTLSTLKRHEEAAPHLDKAIQRWTVQASTAPESMQRLGRAYHARARLNLERGRREQALADAEKAVRYHPGSALSWSVRGEAKQALGRKAEQWLSDFARAAELDPGNYGPRYERAAAAARREQGGRAAPAATGGRWVLPDSAVPVGLGGLGLLFAGLGAGMLLARRS